MTTVSPSVAPTAAPTTVGSKGGSAADEQAFGQALERTARASEAETPGRRQPRRANATASDNKIEPPASTPAPVEREPAVKAEPASAEVVSLDTSKTNADLPDAADPEIIPDTASPAAPVAAPASAALPTAPDADLNEANITSMAEGAADELFISAPSPSGAPPLSRDPNPADANALEESSGLLRPADATTSASPVPATIGETNLADAALSKTAPDKATPTPAISNAAPLPKTAPPVDAAMVGVAEDELPAVPATGTSRPPTSDEATPAKDKPGPVEASASQPTEDAAAVLPDKAVAIARDIAKAAAETARASTTPPPVPSADGQAASPAHTPAAASRSIGDTSKPSPSSAPPVATSPRGAIRSASLASAAPVQGVASAQLSAQVATQIAGLTDVQTPASVATPGVGPGPVIDTAPVPVAALIAASTETIDDPTIETTAPGSAPAALMTDMKSEAVASTPGSALASVAVETTAHLAAQIARRLEGRSTRFEIALAPDDLGRVDVSLDIDADGGLTARLAFDNPLAATELRGRADELRRQLQDAGFTVGADSLSFSERETGSSGGGDRRFERHAERAFAGASRLNDDLELAVVAPAWISHSQTPQGVDLKV